MLVIFYGTSCVGKTTIMKYLHDNYGWKFITTYMTREQREGEFEKIKIPFKQMKLCEKKGDYLFVNNYANNIYATPRSEIEHAVNNDGIWCLDFPLDKRYVFESFNHFEILVLPESKEQLLNQIINCKREERMQQIMNEYEDYLKGYYDITTIININNQLDKTCCHINKIVRSKM